MLNLDELKTKLLGLDEPDNLTRIGYDTNGNMRPVKSSLKDREHGNDHPYRGFTMCGKLRLDSLHEQLDYIRENNIPGDLIECGVWRGGMAIFMAAYCEHYSLDKKVYVADSFEGMPLPEIPQDKNLTDWKQKHLIVPLEEVQDNFRKCAVPMDNVFFVKGWFKDSLPALQESTWSIIRADGDYYKSTMDILTNLYPGLSSGGVAIIDDYGCVGPCREAVTDYRKQNGIDDTIVSVDWTCVLWKKS